MIYFNLAQIKSFIKFCANIPAICFSLLDQFRDFIAPTCFSVCFSKAMGKYADYNQLHNILRLYDVSPNFPFTAIETMLDYYL